MPRLLHRAGSERAVHVPVRYLLHATTRQVKDKRGVVLFPECYLGHVTAVGALPTLAVAAIASAWLRGLRFEIVSPVRPPERNEP